LLAFGSYHELSINGGVVLSLADATFSGGLLGFYVETAELQIGELVVHQLDSPTQTDEHLVRG
ncbi:MAG: glycosyl hydrolase, partial [Planctomycetota bacterium]